MSPLQPHAPAGDGARLRLTFGQALRRYFVTGLATLFPMSVTIWVLFKTFEIADGLLGNALGFQIPGLGLVVTVAVILLVGVLSVHLFGRGFSDLVEFAFKRLPLIRTVYPPVKQLADFLFGSEKGNKAFRRVVIIPYPRPGVYSIAFVTNETKTTAAGKA